MKQSCVMAAGLVVSGCTSYTAASPSENLFDWVTISDPGNPAFDRPTISLFATGRGSVSYEYRIARNEVSTGQYLEFLNTFTTQSNSLASLIETPTFWGGERDFSYTGPGVRYKLRTDVSNAAQLPLVGVTWREAAYFVNWMNNDLSSDASAIENGAYDTTTFTGSAQAGYNDQGARHAEARYFLPTYDEWIKAAHYDPDQNSTGDGGWWMFNNGTDEQPIGGPPGEGETSAGWVVNGTDGRPARDTPLGSYPQTKSPWGLLDVSGGGGEWTETWQPGASVNRDRLWQGGVAGSFAMTDSIDYPAASLAGFRNGMVSFRVAAVVPAPVSAAVPLWIAALTCRRKR